MPRSPRSTQAPDPDSLEDVEAGMRYVALLAEAHPERARELGQVFKVLEALAEELRGEAAVAARMRALLEGGGGSRPPASAPRGGARARSAPPPPPSS